MQIDYYTKYGCSLCDEGLSILRRFPEIDIRIVDVEEDIEKYHSYLLRIPVITYDNGNKEIAWPFDEEDIGKIVSSVKFQEE
jgi:hypothetical protein